MPEPTHEFTPTQERQAVQTAQRLFRDHGNLFYAFTRDFGVRFSLTDASTSTFDPENGTIGLPWQFFTEHHEGVKTAMAAIGHELGHLADVIKDHEYMRHTYPGSDRQEHHPLFNAGDDIRIDNDFHDYPPLDEENKSRYRQLNQTDFSQTPLAEQYVYNLIHLARLGEHLENVDFRVREAIDKKKMMNNVDVLRLIKKTPDPKTRHAIVEKVFLPDFIRFRQEDEQEGRKPFEDFPQATDCRHTHVHGQPFRLSDQDLKKLSEYVEMRKNQPEETPEQIAARMTASSQRASAHAVGEYQKDHDAIREKVNDMADQLERLTEPSFGIVRRQSPPVRRGPRLDKSRMHQAFIMLQTGRPAPVFRRTETRRSTNPVLPTHVNIHLVADMSYSMKGEKERQQRQAVVLGLEGISEFMRRQERTRSRTGLWDAGMDMQVGVHRFGVSHKTLKKPQDELTPERKTYVHQNLLKARDDGTRDDLTLNQLLRSIEALPDETRQEILEQKNKHIIVVMTDGKSHTPAVARALVGQLRQRGVTVWGIGITQAGRAVHGVYGPHSIVIDHPHELPQAVGDLIAQTLHLHATNENQLRK